MRSRWLGAIGAGLIAASVAIAAPRAQRDVDGPVVVVETTRGAFTVQTYPEEAPLTIAHVVDLAERGFYDGQRVHRVVAGVLVQFGDPQTRDVTLRDLWGRGPGASSGQPIGLAEITNRLRHVRGAVAMAHPGDPALADSQIFVALADTPALDGHYAVFGTVVAGLEVPERLEIGDLIRRVSVRR